MERMFDGVVTAIIVFAILIFFLGFGAAKGCGYVCSKYEIKIQAVEDKGGQG